MSHKVLASIRWVTPAEGGRKTPPRVPRYSTVARFETTAASWPAEAWSIVAEFMERLDNCSGVLAEVWLLTPDAPAHLLKTGSRFDLFEGRRLVAHGEVLQELHAERKSHSMLEMRE